MNDCSLNFFLPDYENTVVAHCKTLLFFYNRLPLHDTDRHCIDFFLSSLNFKLKLRLDKKSQIYLF